jgi:uncharacterized protein YjbI with pentapeptide repeats
MSDNTMMRGFFDGDRLSRFSWLFGAVTMAIVCCCAASRSRANIYEWTTDGQGNVIQSSTLCPGGGGVTAAPYVYLIQLNLTQAYLLNANLTDADLYLATLANANLTNANLTGANFNYATLTNANFTGADVAGAQFFQASLTQSQLYSTASYKADDLHGIVLTMYNLAGWNFAGQNMTGADLEYSGLVNANMQNCNLTDATLIAAGLINTNLAGANMTNDFFIGATISNVNFTAADLRGAYEFVAGSSTTTNTILPNGTIQGLNLGAADPSLVVRNYAYGNYGQTPVPINVTQTASIGPGTTMQLVLDGNAWGSTISFQAGIPVTLGGNLELGLAPGVDPSTLVGDSFQLFNWTGVSPSGQFQIVNDLSAEGYSWNTSALYTTGDVTLVPEPSTLLLLAVAVIGLAAHVWRRK